MKFPIINFRSIINPLFISIIFTSILFPSPSSAYFSQPVNSTNYDSKMPGLSKTSINAPNAPDATDAEPDITINDVTVSEGDSGTTDAVFWVNLSEVYTQTITVEYYTQDITAVSSADYTDTFGTLTFRANVDVTLPITVPVLGDYFDEINETFTVTLSNPSHGILLDADGLGTITDDDTAGISAAPLNLTTSETGTTDEFTLVLTSQPTEIVHITLIVTDTTEGTLSEVGFAFNSQNWGTPHAITVTGEDDPEFDGDITYAIQIQASSTDPLYDGIPTDDVIVTNLDDEPPIVVSPLALTTSEAGLSDTFTVSLTTAPTAAVTITLSSSNIDEGTVSPPSLSFAIENWDSPQPVTVTGVDDPVDDSDQPYTIVTGAAVSADPNYGGSDVADVSVINLDNDTAGITVTPLDFETNEQGDTGSFTVALTSQPTAPVTITLSSSNTGEGTVPPTSLSFTTGNWDTPQQVTVTGVDDPVDDGDTAYAIQFAVSSADGIYDGMLVADVEFTNIDDDTAGITVFPVSDLWTDESGGQAAFNVVLDSQPTAVVTIDLTSSNTNEGEISTGTLVFNNANWNSPQQITITGVDDNVVDGDMLYTIITDAAVSADPLYNLMDPDDVSVTNSDDDAVGIDVYPTSGLTTTESGDTAIFSVVLESEPFLDVTLHLTSSNTTEGVITPDILVFSAANWNIPQEITITGVDDDVIDGNILYTILTGPTISGDGNFNGINPPNVTVRNFDNDVAGISITAGSDLTTTESGGTATFSVVLDTQPSRSVNIHFQSLNEDEGIVLEEIITFITTTWDIPKDVVITGKDDYWDDGDQPYDIQLLVYSGDVNYDGMILPDVPVTNLDNDQAGFIILPTSGLTTNEGGGDDTFTIRLTSQPRETVTISLSSSDTSEGTVSPGSRVFNQFNWTQSQSVTVTGVDDVLVDGDIGYSIVTAPAVSADPVYHGMNPPNISVTNQDDDQAVDTEIPTVDWLSPVGDGKQMVISFSPNNPFIQLEVIANDNSEIERVRFYRWDAINLTRVEIGNVYSTPFRIEIDTSSLNFGWNQINAKAYDIAGNESDVLHGNDYIWLIRYWLFMPNILK